MPQPDWLIDRKKLAGRFPPRVRAKELWRVAPEWLDQAQDDATLLAIRDQERAGLDIITDGEMRRESYSNRFATALEGVDIDNPGTALDRSGHPNPVPRVAGKVRRKHPVEVRDVKFLRANTDRTDQDHGARPVHHVAAGAERFLQGRGGDGARLRRRGQRRDQGPVRGRRRHRADRRALHAGAAGQGARVRPEGAQRARSTASTARPRCTSASAMPRSSTCGRRAIRSCRSSRTRRCSRSRSRPRSPKLDCAVLEKLPGKTIILGVLDLSDMTIETPETVAARIRRALPHVAAGADRRRAGLRPEIPAARGRVRQRCRRWSKARRSCAGTRTRPDAALRHNGVVQPRERLERRGHKRGNNAARMNAMIGSPVDPNRIRREETSWPTTEAPFYGAAALAALLASAPAMAWEPTKPVEIVVAAGAGGASDQMARMMQAAIQKNNLMKQPMIVSLKGGASGAEALMYMKSSDGDPNKVLHRLFADLHAAAVRQDPVQLARPDAGRGHRARPVRAVGQRRRAATRTSRNSSTPRRPPTRRSRWAAPARSARTTCSRSSWRRRPARSSPTCRTSRAARRRRSSSATTPQANVNNPSENLEVWRAGQVRALCVFDKERIAYKTKVTDDAVVERHPDLQGSRVSTCST